MSTSASLTALAPDALVRCWVDAFNAQDLECMLARLDPEVRFHPLRLSGLDGSYRTARDWRASDSQSMLRARAAEVPERDERSDR